MKHYKSMTIGMTIDKSEAKNNFEQIYLAPTPYIKTSSCRSVKPRKIFDFSFLSKMLCRNTKLR